MTLSLMVSSTDQKILWVSDGLADHLDAPSSPIVGSSVFDLLEGSPSALWHSLFTGIESVDERFDGYPVHRVGGSTSLDEFELRGVRYVDAGRGVMISLRASGSCVGSGDAELLAEAERRYDELLQGSFDAVIVHDGRYVLFMNAVARRLAGIDPAEVAGTALASIIEPSRAAHEEPPVPPPGPPDDSGTSRVRLVLRHTSGDSVEVEASMALVSFRHRKAVQVVLHDLTEEHRSRRADTCRDLVAENVMDAVVSTDDQLRIVGWNRAASSLYGWTLSEVAGKNIVDVLGAPVSVNLATSGANESGERSDVSIGAHAHRHRDGRELSVEAAQIVLRDTNGVPWGLLGVSRRSPTAEVHGEAPSDAARQVEADDAGLVVELRAAVANDEIFVVYQPVVELDSRHLHHVEALARWTSPARGEVSPGQFIPLAERSGIIDELGEFILERACTEVLLMHREGIDVELSVNISVVQLRDPAVSRRIGRILTATGFPPARLHIEVTEGVLLDERALLPLQALHDMGIRLVVDDFGTGYATFQYLTRFPVDALKIDASFVSGLGTDTRSTAIVRAVVNLSRELGVEVVAEGVETESQRAALIEMNCRFGQGWLFDRGLPFAELVARYRNGTPAVSRPATTTSATTTSRPAATDPEADAARLAAARSLLRTDTVEAAVGVCIALVRELGGRTIPARLDDGRALPIDCSFGHGEPLLPIADSVLAQSRLGRVLPEVLEDARLAISRIRQNADLLDQTRTDPLTGLMNRRATDRVLATMHTDDALVAIDLDHFKAVNDTWGHAAGDDVLIAYSRALRATGRSTDHFARIGGEELLAVLPGTDEVGLAAFLEQLHETWLAIRPYDVTYSAGCAWAGGRSGTETLSIADEALFRAKQTGGDRTIIEPRRVAVTPAGASPRTRRKKDA